MQNDPKPEAEITDKDGAAVKTATVPVVANPDPKELDRTTGDAPPKNAPSLDRLDKERAADEGMIPPSTP